ncbi:hypothetical protein ACFSJW_10720 [Flavobacterium artemisiae]|uniref:Thioredoxin-like n=1 Tax=Flavobacterium artemisiae TaxID=2126556 RepID=A0ABW4HF86_9FLAO
MRNVVWGFFAFLNSVCVSFAQEKTIDFKFKIQNNLKDAITVTKQDNSKFLIVYCDEKNPNAIQDFDSFIEYKEEIINSDMYDKYDPQYDLFNYYLASAADQNWIKSNNISDFPAVIILNGDGDILASKKAKLSRAADELCSYCGEYKKVNTVNAIANFNKVAKNTASTDNDLIEAFYSISDFVDYYNYDYVYEGNTEKYPNSFKMQQIVNEEQVNSIWKKIIELHQNDQTPNLKLVSVILREIQDKGFSKVFFNGGKILNNVDFLSIDYLLKHYDAIVDARNKLTDEDSYLSKIDNLNVYIAYALNDNINIEKEGKTGKSNLEKIINVHKKLIELGKSNYPCCQYYFSYLIDQSSDSGSDLVFIKEFEAYFDKFLFTEKGDYIEKLDQLFSSGFSYDYGWDSFKEFHSNLCNSAAWRVVSKPENSIYLKKAIKWSEYSLVVTKNNPYYLDTLAQLYYKDGQKEKAVETQTLAVKYLNNTVDESTAEDIRQTLDKMKNGTY